MYQHREVTSQQGRELEQHCLNIFMVNCVSVGLNPVSVEAVFTVYQGGKETRRCSGKLIEQPCTKPLKMVGTMVIIVVVMFVLMKMMTMTMVRAMFM